MVGRDHCLEKFGQCLGVTSACIDTESLVDQAFIETILAVQWRRGLKGSEQRQGGQ